MRIALLSYEYPPDTGFGGIGTYTWYQARALVRLGHEVRVIAGSLEPGVHQFEHDGVRVTRVLDHGFLQGAIEGLTRAGSTWAPNRLSTAAGAHLALSNVLRDESFDMVEFPDCGADGMLVSTLLPVRSCVRFHSPARLIMDTYGAGDDDIATTGFLEQVGIDRADLRTSPSRYLAAEVVDRMGVDQPVHVVPNGIDLELFDRDEGIDVAERFGLPSTDAVTIFFSSRLEQRKGVHLLEEICSKILGAHPNVHVVVAGADADGVVERAVRPTLERQGLGGRFHDLGRRSLPEVRAIVKHVDIHLHPTQWDNAPYACLEAMAAGLPIVASDVGGMPEMVEHETTGLLAPQDDPASMVDALSRLVEDPELRERLGHAGRRAVEERYTDVVVAQQTIDVWNGETPSTL